MRVNGICKVGMRLSDLGEVLKHVSGVCQPLGFRASSLFALSALEVHGQTLDRQTLDRQTLDTTNPGHDKPWTRQTLDTTNPGYDKPWTQ
jgi:hypothetical protein